MSGTHVEQASTRRGRPSTAFSAALSAQNRTRFRAINGRDKEVRRNESFGDRRIPTDARIPFSGVSRVFRLPGTLREFSRRVVVIKITLQLR